MSRRSNRDPNPWTPEEDAILVECWPDQDIDFAAIAKLIPGSRTVGAVKHRGYKIGLGQKAGPETPEITPKILSAWPDNMPSFEDHPEAAAPGPRAKAIRLGSRFKSITRDAESSPAGSSLGGAAFHPTGRRV